MKDVVIVLKLGKRALLKCFLEIKTILARDDCMYVLDKIWINDYCIWIQRADDKQIAALATELHHYKIEKEQVGWNLEELERNSLEVKNGAMENDDIDQNINDADSERNAANSEFILPKTENVAVSAESVGNLDDPNANRGERESEAKLARYFGIQELS